jgi:hypothetical protein
MIGNPRRSGLLGAALMVLFVTGCPSAIERANRGSFERHVRELLQKADLADLVIDCRMNSATRDGKCEFSADRAQIETLARALALVAASADSPQDRIARSSQRFSALGQRYREGQGITVYVAAGRPPQLRLEDGSAFEFCVLYFDEAGGRACLELSYAYG